MPNPIPDFKGMFLEIHHEAFLQISLYITRNDKFRLDIECQGMSDMYEGDYMVQVLNLQNQELDFLTGNQENNWPTFCKA